MPNTDDTHTAAVHGDGGAISMDKKYSTRDGYGVRIYAVYEDDIALPVHGVIFHDSGPEIAAWSADGRFWGATNKLKDLIEVRSAEDVVREALADQRLSLDPAVHYGAVLACKALRKAEIIPEGK